MPAPKRPTAATGSRADAIAKQRERDRLQKNSAPLVGTSRDTVLGLRALVQDVPDHDAESQADRMLLALFTESVTSHEARQYLDIVHPAGRVFTLRDRGYLIDMTWVRQRTACGKVHRFGRYTLMRHA